MNFLKSPQHRTAFTLVELLVVVSIIIVMLAISGPAFRGLSNSQSLTAGADQLAGQLNLARQTAIGQNSAVWVNFYSFDDPETSVSTEGIRKFITTQGISRGVQTAAGKLQSLPDGIMVIPPQSSYNADALTSLPTLEAGNNNLPDIPSNYQVTGFAFMPDGSTSLSNDRQWHMTVVRERDKGEPPPNFATVNIEPATGQIKVYRP